MVSVNRPTDMCIECRCQPSVASCNGCQRKFCHTCFNRHRDQLARDFDQIVDRRNELVGFIQTHIPNDLTDRSAFFEGIDQWEGRMYAKIASVASKARDHVRKHLSNVKSDVEKEFKRLSDELQEKQKIGGYTERDLNLTEEQLTKLKEKIQRLKDDIRIDTTASEKISWDSLIIVKLPTNTYPVTVSRPPSNTYSHSPPPIYNSAPLRSQPPPSYYQVNPSPVRTPNISRHTYGPSLPNMPTGRESRLTSMTCVGCKTNNVCYEGKQNYCTVCKQLIQF